MGRKKIKIERIKKLSGRRITFSKRGKGFLKKAEELSTLCGIDIGVIMFSPDDKLFCRPETTIEKVLQRWFEHTSQGQMESNRESVNELLHQRNTEKKGKSGLSRVRAVKQRRLAEQCELAAKEQEIDYNTGRFEQAQSLEDLIMARVKQSISLTELGDLENFIQNRLSKVQERMHFMELRRQQIEDELMEILSAPV